MLKKLNSKITNNQLNLYSYSKSFELSDSLDPIGSSIEETITEYEDFTMPILKHTIKIKNPKTKKESDITLSGLNDFFG